MSTAARRQSAGGDARHPRHHSSERRNGRSGSGIVTDPRAGRAVFTYRYEPEPCRFRVKHDRKRHVLRITGPDAETAEFEDEPVRFLVVVADAKTGEIRPFLAGGKPKIMLLCREAGP